MATTEVTLEGDDRNFTINFGPQHPAAHGAVSYTHLTLPTICSV